mgnify:CR=1 FL=1
MMRKGFNAVNKHLNAIQKQMSKMEQALKAEFFNNEVNDLREKFGVLDDNYDGERML